MTDKPLVFSIPGFETLQDELSSAIGGEIGRIERTRFLDGERYQRLMNSVEDRDVVIVGGTVDDEATLCVYDLACAAAKTGARRLTLIVPYFGYSTMERAVRPGEVVTAKIRARLLSSVPPASYGNRVLLLDLHNEGIAHYFEAGVRSVHISAKSVLVPVIKELGGDDYVLASTDAGRAKWVESMANDIGVEAAFILKRRIDASTVQLTALSADVESRDVVIYDDMIRSGGSLLNAAQAYRDAGARRLFAVCTHGVFTPGAYHRLRDSGLFDAIVSTDSHPVARALQSEGLRVLSTVSLFTPFFGH